LGATKLRVELAEALQELGWSSAVYGPEDIGAPAPQTLSQGKTYAQKLQRFLLEHHNDMDVALFEADSLPFQRQDMPEDVLLVAQPALVYAHDHLIKYPVPKAAIWRKALRRIKRKIRPNARWLSEERRPMQQITCQNVDLVQCLNPWDADMLKADGVRLTPMVTIPTGISAERLSLLAKTHQKLSPCDHKKIAFVGTFDYRKGCLDIVELMNNLWSNNNTFTLKILGSQGLFQTESSVRRHFRMERQKQIEVQPRFENDQLPDLLSDCTLGIFPSYIESFGIGCLETMAAGIPTVAYASPGPESFVPKNLQVKPSDVAGMRALLIRLSSKEGSDDYQRMARASIDTAWKFEWGKVARKTAEVYEEHLLRLRNRR
jgi:glycosyltransferase involved in cell wall biosynthesis